jgi:hypothetical protein
MAKRCVVVIQLLAGSLALRVPRPAAAEDRCACDSEQRWQARSGGGLPARFAVQAPPRQVPTSQLITG